MELEQEMVNNSNGSEKKRFQKRIKREKKPATERLKDFFFLLPAYIALIVFVFIPIIFSVLISFFENPTALQLRNAFEYYFNFNNLSLVSVLDFFYSPDPFAKGIFTIAGITLLLTIILTIWYTRLVYRRFRIFKRFKSPIVRGGLAFIFGLIVAPLTLFIVEWIIKGLGFATGILGIPLEEFRNVLTTPNINFLRILFNTFFWTLTCTVIHILLGIGLAILLNRKFKGRGIFRSLFILPWAIPSFVSTLMWRSYVFDKDSGVLGTLVPLFGSSYSFSVSNFIGLILAVILTIFIAIYFYKYLNKRFKINPNLRGLILFAILIGGFFLFFFLNDLFQLAFVQFQEGILGYKLINIPEISSTFWYTDTIYILGINFKMITFSAIIVNVWLGVPFMMLSFLATLQSIPKELYEAAEIDGLTSWAQFKKVTFPLLRPTLLTVSLLGIIWTFNLFNVVFLLTQNQTGLGDPVNYNIFVTFIYGRFSVGEYSQASALSFTVFVILISFSLVYRRMINAEKLWEGEK
jgi:ABC-type sugar transport system permease subunit